MPNIYTTDSRYDVSKNLTWSATFANPVTDTFEGAGYITSIIYAGNVDNDDIFDQGNTVTDGDFGIWGTKPIDTDAEYPLDYNKCLVSITIDGIGEADENKSYSLFDRGGVEASTLSGARIVIRDTSDITKPLGNIAYSAEIEDDVLALITNNPSSTFTLECELLNSDIIAVTISNDEQSHLICMT